MKKLALFLLIILSIQSAIAQNTLDNLGLDNTVPAAVAFSLRKLSSSYSGYAIQVRRSSDNTTQDIGFASSGALDTTALKTFVGANNGLVTIWYDQSGNARNLTQTNTSKQPTIVSGGVIYRRNGLPVVFHDEVDDGMLYSGSSYLTATPLSVNIVAGSNGDNIGARAAVQGSKYWVVGPYSNSHGWLVTGGWNHIITVPWSTYSLETFTVIQPATNANTSFRNGATQTTLNNKGVPDKIQTGNEGIFSAPFNGFINEILVFNSELSISNRKTIESNQGVFYDICLLNTQPTSNNQSVVLGGTPTSLSVLSDDPNATYQWYSNTVKSNRGGTMLNGETGTSYSPNTSVEGTLYYYAVVTTSTSSSASNLSGYVRVGIEITSQPSTAYQAVLKDSSTNALSVTATGANITYQWYKNTTNSNINGTLISGATTNTYTPLTTDLGLNYYYVVVSGLNTVLTSNTSGAVDVLVTLPIVWNGPNITFTKTAGADFTLAANQDFITNNVTITRKNSSSEGLINITKESSYNSRSSPNDTEWARVTSNDLTASEIKALNFVTFSRVTTFISGSITLNRTYLVHLITDDIYLYIKILSWNTSGGFSYERSTNPNAVQVKVVTKNGESANPKTTTVDKNGALNTTKGVTKNGEIKNQ